MKRKIIIAGGSGALGASLIDAWKNHDVEIVVLTRKKVPAQEGRVRYITWDARSLGSWQQAIEGSDVVINLVGKSVNCRYTEGNKREIIRSRVDATHVLGTAIAQATAPPSLWINAGSVAIFGNTRASIKTEASTDFGEGFSSGVCKRWESVFWDADTPFTRQVVLRMGMVLQRKGGVLKPFVKLVRFGLGGSIGTGGQYISWLHEADFVRVVEWVIENPAVQGILHACSPFPVSNHVFMRTIRQELRVPFGLPNPAWSTKIGAWLIGTESELVLSGRRVVSRLLEKEQFEFKFPEIVTAFRNLAL